MTRAIYVTRERRICATGVDEIPSNNPPAKPGAFRCEPLKAAG